MNVSLGSRNRFNKRFSIGIVAEGLHINTASLESAAVVLAKTSVFSMSDNLLLEPAVPTMPISPIAPVAQYTKSANLTPSKSTEPIKRQEVPRIPETLVGINFLDVASHTSLLNSSTDYDAPSTGTSIQDTSITIPPRNVEEVPKVHRLVWPRQLP